MIRWVAVQRVCMVTQLGPSRPQRCKNTWAPHAEKIMASSLQPGKKKKRGGQTWTNSCVWGLLHSPCRLVCSSVTTALPFVNLGPFCRPWCLFHKSCSVTVTWSEATFVTLWLSAQFPWKTIPPLPPKKKKGEADVSRSTPRTFSKVSYAQEV